MTEYYSEEEKFNEMTKASADDLGIRIVDMRSKIASVSNLFHFDGLHLNECGYKYLRKEIERILKL